MSEKSPATEKARPVKVVAPGPLAFVTVIVWGGLMRPRVSEPKLTTAGVTVRPPAAMPLPLTAMEAGRTPAEVVVTATEEFRAPTDAGVNTTAAVQLAGTQEPELQAGAGSVAGQVFWTSLKSPEVVSVRPATLP